MSESTAIVPNSLLTRLFPKQAPAPWHYAVWYVFLALWMQGEALLNTLWILLFIISLPYIPFAIERIRPYRWLWISIVVYLGLRLLSVTYAIDTKYALYGVTDDFRIFSIGLLFLTYMRTKEQLRNAVITTLAGFGLLAWHALANHWLSSHSLGASTNVEFGSLAHVNYAATFTATVLFTLFVASRHVSKRWLFAIALIAIPLCLMQAPLASRTTILLLTTTVACYVLLKRPGWIATTAIALSIAIVTTVLVQTKQTWQYYNLQTPLQHESIYIRVDIWKTMLQIWKDHPMGIGPRNFKAIDMNPYREWIYENTPNIATRFYGDEAMRDQLQSIDLNQAGHFVTDPHSHYVSLFTENGPLGLLALISYLLAIFVIAIRYSFCRNNWTSGFGEAAAGGLVLMGGAGLMTAVFYQSGGIITVMLITFLLASIDIHGTEKEERIEG